MDAGRGRLHRSPSKEKLFGAVQLLGRFHLATQALGTAATVIPEVSPNGCSSPSGWTREP